MKRSLNRYKGYGLMQLTQQDVDYIVDYVIKQAETQDIYNAAFDILTNGGRFSSNRWDRMISAMPLAIGYFMDVERKTENAAFDEALHYVSYFSSVKIIMEEVSISDSLSDQDYNAMKIENEKRISFEELLMEYKQAGNSRSTIMDRRGGSSSSYGVNERNVGMGMGMGMGNSRHVEPAPVSQHSSFGKSTSVAAATRSNVSKVPEGLSENSFNKHAERRAPSVAPSKVHRAECKEPETVEVIKTKEYTVVSNENFNLDLYPDHFKLAFNDREVARNDSKRLDEHLDRLLADTDKVEPGTSQAVLGMKVKAESPDVTFVPVAPSLKYCLTSVESTKHGLTDLMAESADYKDAPIEIKAVCYKPVYTSTSDKVMTFLIDNSIGDMAEAKSYRELFKLVSNLRQYSSVEHVNVNNLLSRLAQIAVGKLINNAIPEQITSSDVIADWETIYESVLKYVQDSQLSTKHISTSAETVLHESKTVLDDYLAGSFEEVRDFMACLETENSLEDEEVSTIKTLWGIHKHAESIWQSNTAAMLYLPISANDLGLYVNNRETFDLHQSKAETLFSIIDMFALRTTKYEDKFNPDFIFISFSEKDIYRIARINISATEYFYRLVLTTDII